MAGLRVALVAGLLLAVATVGHAQKEKEKGKIDKAKLVGTWTFVKTDSKDAPPAGIDLKMEFTKDGKVNVTAKIKEKTIKVTGSYTLKGDQLTVTTKGPGGKEKTETETIKELTDKKLVTIEKKGDDTYTTEYKR